MTNIELPDPEGKEARRASRLRLQIATITGALSLCTAAIARADPPADPPPAASPSAPPEAGAPAPSAAPSSAPSAAPSSAPSAAPSSAPAAAPSGAPSAAPSSAPAAPPKRDKKDAAPAPLDKVPRVIGLAVGWAWNTVDRLPVSLDNKKPQPHGLSVFSDFTWQVSGLAGGWPSWLGFMAGFLYFPGAPNVRRETFAMEYGIVVRHALFPGFILRPFLGYGLGATQAWVPGVMERGIGHLTRLSMGTDIVVKPTFTLSLEIVYKIINMPTYGPPAADPPSTSYDFHTLSALFGAHYQP